MQAVVVEELAPSRIEVDDSAAIRASLEEYGFACVRGAVTSDELTHARDLLWKFLEGDEAPCMTQRRPVGWKRGQPTTWVEGHGDALMTSTTHNESMWFVRSRPGVLAGFAAAYGVPESQLVADFDRMSINLPTSSGNDAALRVAERRYQHGKLGVAQEMHTHWTEYYGADHTNYYSIVPLFDMNQMTGATALVPGSHKKVEEIQSARAKNWIGTGKDRRWVGKGSPFIEPFSSNGLMPVVTNGPRQGTWCCSTRRHSTYAPNCTVLGSHFLRCSDTVLMLRLAYDRVGALRRIPAALQATGRTSFFAQFTSSE